MGTLEQWEKDLLGQVEPKEVQRDPSGNGGGCCCLGVVLVLLVVLALAVQGWAACVDNGYVLGDTPYGECKNFYSGAGGAWDAGAFTAECESKYQLCPSVVQHGGYSYAIADYNENRCRSTLSGCGYRELKTAYSCYYDVMCSDSTEADSVRCVNEGESWNPTTRKCEEDPCEGYEDYLQDLKDACRQNGGTDDFALVPNSDGTCGTAGFCDLCTEAKKKEAIESARKSCCELGSGFNSSSFNFSCKTTIDGFDKTWDYTYKGCDYNFNVSISPNGSSVATGCGPQDDDPENPENPDSSPSGGGSSDSQGGGSSGSEGGDLPDDSTGTGASSSASQAEQDISQMADDIGKMVSQDSAQLSNTEDIKQILLDYMRCVYDEDCPLNRRDTTIVNVSGGGGGGEVTIDLTALTNAVNNGNAISEANGEKLDSINAKLGSLGLDSIRAAIVAGDSSIKAAIDDLGGIIAGLDSTAAGLASRLDSNRAILGSIDSTLKALGDTSGGGGFDTSGYMAILRGWGDSLGVALWGYPCDTTGGRNCDNEVIGADGLANARSDFAAAGRALGDSLNGGAVGDSLAHWSQTLSSGGGVLQGEGSAACPSVFTRTWTIPLGPTGMTYEFGPFGSIVCYDFFGGITFWALARVVLRALVAITCMWWLFKAVTGTEGGNDED